VTVKLVAVNLLVTRASTVTVSVTFLVALLVCVRWIIVEIVEVTVKVLVTVCGLVTVAVVRIVTPFICETEAVWVPVLVTKTVAVAGTVDVVKAKHEHAVESRFLPMSAAQGGRCGGPGGICADRSSMTGVDSRLLTPAGRSPGRNVGRELKECQSHSNQKAVASYIVEYAVLQTVLIETLEAVHVSGSPRTW